jgi:hypothetical protein
MLTSDPWKTKFRGQLTLVAGKVCGRLEQRVGNNSGRPFVMAKVRAATGSGEMLFVNVLAFDPTTQAALLALCEGPGK